VKAPKKKIGVITAICGPPNSGKSKEGIRRIEDSKRWNYIYDPHREYQNRLSKEALSRTTLFYTLKSFKENLKNFQDANIIVEETITFLRMFRDDEIADLLSSICHDGNAVFLIFHAVKDIPIYCLTFINYIVVLPTGEDFEFLKRSRTKLHKILVEEKPQLPYTFCNQPPQF
jgi:hypothetical protein